MRAWHFSENAYPYLPPENEYESIRVTLPNRNYDPKKGAALYDRFLDEWCIAEDEGMEIMLNEHHQTATCVDPAAPIVLGALARLTSKARMMLVTLVELCDADKPPTYSKWLKAVDCPESTFIAGLKTLKDGGWVTKQPGKRGVTTYSATDKSRTAVAPHHTNEAPNAASGARSKHHTKHHP